VTIAGTVETLPQLVKEESVCCEYTFDSVSAPPGLVTGAFGK